MASLPIPNALVESALINLRCVAGFVLAHTGCIVTKVDDARPSWFVNGKTWVPASNRCQVAINSFYNAVGGTLAHAAIKTTAHPGHWPIDEALLVLSRELTAMLAKVDPREVARFTAGSFRLPELLRDIQSFPFKAYAPRRTSQPVARSRRLLRTQLGW